jgi:N-acetylglucosamine-6-phosphate deacetylase
MGAMRTVIHRARLISPGSGIRDGILVIEDGRISEVLGNAERLPAADRVLDAEGRMVMPGFIDIHSHGAAGHDVCD